MYLLTELVRLLEQRGFVFASDPQRITDILRQTDGELTSKLYRRASMIDSDGQLNNRLQHHRRRLQLGLILASAIWFMMGFFSSYTLMQNNSLNFVLLLMGVLGVNTLLLLYWLSTLIFRRAARTPISFALLPLKSDPISLAISTLYQHSAQQSQFRWIYAGISHRLALCGLGGMFIAMLALLLVRQYRFNWESTLLSDQTFTAIIHALAWLPNKIGFNTPTDNMIQQARQYAIDADASAWASLLLGALLCYGILPRLMAWLFCQYKRQPLQLDLTQIYYQNIAQQWHRQIIDSDADYMPDQLHKADPLNLDARGEHWAVLLDAPHPNAQWFGQILGHEWLNKGVLAERNDVPQLLEQLSHQPVQLLVGVRAHIGPDRGTLRTLSKLSQHAQAGMVVQLLLDEQQTAHPQWQEVLQQYGWAWLP